MFLYNNGDSFLALQANAYSTQLRSIIIVLIIQLLVFPEIALSQAEYDDFSGAYRLLKDEDCTYSKISVNYYKICDDGETRRHYIPLNGSAEYIYHSLQQPQSWIDTFPRTRSYFDIGDDELGLPAYWFTEIFRIDGFFANCNIIYLHPGVAVVINIWDNGTFSQTVWGTNNSVQDSLSCREELVSYHTAESMRDFQTCDEFWTHQDDLGNTLTCRD